MSEPEADDPESAPISPAPSSRRLGSTLAAAAAVIVVVGALAATPFWAPSLMRLLPWGAAAEKPQPASPNPTATEASRNATTVQQLSQRIAALEAKPAPDQSGLQQRVAALEGRPAPDLSGVQQQLAALDKTTADLGQKITALDKAEQQQQATNPKTTALALVLLQIRDAVETGRPFDAEYQALAALSREHPDIAAAAAPLAEPAQSGVASRAALIERLRQLAPQIATAHPPPKPGWKSQVVAQLRSLVTIRRIEGDERNPAEAAVGDAQSDLASGDLAGAIAALDKLDGASKTAAAPWLKMAQARLAAETALRQVQAALTTALGAAAPPLAEQGG
jgi:hypothetical protein